MIKLSIKMSTHYIRGSHIMLKLMNHQGMVQLIKGHGAENQMLSYKFYL